MGKRDALSGAAGKQQRRPVSAELPALLCMCDQTAPSEECGSQRRLRGLTGAEVDARVNVRQREVDARISGG